MVSEAYKNCSTVVQDTPSRHIGQGGLFMFFWNYWRYGQQQEFSVEISLAGTYVSFQFTDGHFGEFSRVVIPLVWTETHSSYDCVLCSFVNQLFSFRDQIIWHSFHDSIYDPQKSSDTMFSCRLLPFWLAINWCSRREPYLYPSRWCKFSETFPSVIIPDMKK